MSNRVRDWRGSHNVRDCPISIDSSKLIAPYYRTTPSPCCCRFIGDNSRSHRSTTVACGPASCIHKAAAVARVVSLSLAAVEETDCYDQSDGKESLIHVSEMARNESVRTIAWKYFGAEN